MASAMELLTLPTGELEVEDHRAGETVISFMGLTRPTSSSRWLASRSIECSEGPCRGEVLRRCDRSLTRGRCTHLVHSLSLFEPAVISAPSGPQFFAALAPVVELCHSGNPVQAVNEFFTAVWGS